MRSDQIFGRPISGLMFDEWRKLEQNLKPGQVVPVYDVQKGLWPDNIVWYNLEENKPMSCKNCKEEKAKPTVTIRPVDNGVLIEDGNRSTFEMVSTMAFTDRAAFMKYMGDLYFGKEISYGAA